VLFGGTENGAALGDSWTWDGRAWEEQCAACGPAARTAASMAPDPIQSTVVLYGGSDGLETALADTWTWDGSAWTQRCADCDPGPRQGAGLAYDAISGSVVLSGGGSGGLLNDLWTWNGSTWSPQQAGQTPAPRRGAAFSYDPAEGKDVLFGGCCDAGGGSFGDTWLWDGQAWTPAGSQTAPAPRSEAGLAIDSIGGKLVLFGGRP
jgi:hypothetical protein